MHTEGLVTITIAYIICPSIWGYTIKRYYVITDVITEEKNKKFPATIVNLNGGGNSAAIVNILRGGNIPPQ